MKKLLLALTGCLALSAAQFNANAGITVDDLTQWGGNCIEIFYGDLNQGGAILWTNSTPVIKKVSNTQFTIQGICDGDYDLTMTLSSNNTVSIPDEETLVARNASWDGQINGLSGSYAYSSSYGWFYYYSNSNITGTVQQVDNDLYLITLNKCEFGMSETLAPQFEAIQFWVFRTNADVTDYVGTSTTPRKYKALVTNNGDSGFKIYNFANRGFGYRVTPTYTLVTNQPLQAMTGYLLEDGIISIENNYACSLNQEYLTRNRSGYFSNYGNVQQWQWFGTPEGDYSDIRSEIAGTYAYNDPAHVNDAETYWVSNGGKCQTLATTEISLTPFAMFRVNSNNEYYDGQWGSIVYNTVYSIKDQDVTHTAQLNISSFGLNDNHILVNGTIEQRDKNDFIDSYDLYIIPGKITSISDGEPHFEDGLTGAIKIAENISAQAGSGATDIPLNVYTDRNADIKDLNDNYTFFLKANHTNGLHHTFMALTSQNTPTGIDDLAAAEAGVEIRVVEGGVEVAGFDGMVEVYNASGAQVFAGVADGRIELASGLYIVKAGTKAQKVNVR